MTTIVNITESAAPVAFGGAFGAVRQRAVAPSASPRRPAPQSPTRSSPNLVAVVPDPGDAIAEVSTEAGFEGASKLLWTLGALPPPAV